MSSLKKGRRAFSAIALMVVVSWSSDSVAQFEPALLVEKTGEDGKPESYLKTLCSRIYFMVYSPDNNELSINYKYRNPLVLETTHWENIRRLPGLRMMAYSPDSTLLATAEGRDGLQIWERGERNPLRWLGEDDDLVLYTAFSPDGKTLASTFGKKGVRIWNPASGDLIHTLKGHKKKVRCLVFSTDGKTLFTGSDRSIKLWNTSTWEEVASWRTPQKAGDITGMTFSSNGVTLATVHSQLGVMVWNTTNSTAYILRYKFCAAFSPDGTQIAVGRKDVFIYDIKLHKDPQGHMDVVTEATEKIKIQELMLKDACHGHTLNSRVDYGDDPRSTSFDNVVALAYTPDGKTLAAGCYDGTIRFFGR